MVLWVIVILSMIVLEFCFSMRTEINTTQHYKGEIQLYRYAEGGIERAIAELINKQDPKIQQLRKTAAADQIPPDKKEWSTDGRSYQLSYDRGTCEVRVIGEGGKININTVQDATLRRIVGQLGLEGEDRDIVTDSILDWIDPDDLTRLNGAENDYYHSLKEPYNCKNANLDSIEELLLVRGVTPDLFYGKKGKKDDSGGQTEGQPGLKDIFSIYAPGTTIDINSAAVPALRVVLGVPTALARQIVMAREQQAFANEQDLVQRVPEMQSLINSARSLIAYQSATLFYTIEAMGKAKEGGAQQGIKAIVKIDPAERSGYKVIQWVDQFL